MYRRICTCGWRRRRGGLKRYGVNLSWGVNPEAGVEEAVVQQLLQQQVAVVGGAGDKVPGGRQFYVCNVRCNGLLGEFEEGVEEVCCEVITGGLGEQVGDHQETLATYHLGGGP